MSELMPALLLSMVALASWLYLNRWRYGIRLPRHLFERTIPNVFLTPDRDRAPVFFIGFYKTGTKYYTQVFKQLGYRVMHDSHWRTGSIRVIKQYDVFNDACLHHYEKMYAAYPRARFILNTRPLRSWLISRVIWIDHVYGRMTQFARRVVNPVHRVIWGNDCYYTDKLIIRWIEERQRYHEDVLRFFADKPDSLLVINAADPGKLDKLSTFLDIPIGPAARNVGPENVSAGADKRRYAQVVDAALSACGISDPEGLH
jgi:hypothetical protein